MQTLPSATTSVSEASPALAAGLDLITVIAPVATAADSTPRLYSSSSAIVDRHGYSQGADYSALHMLLTRLPVLFVGVPIATAGTIGSVDTSGNTGTSAVTLSAGANGVLDEVDLEVSVARGGVVGTDQIKLSISLDGGRTTETVRLGTATSYTIANVGLVLGFVAGGELETDDVILTARTTAPRWDQAGIEAARTALAGVNYASRRWLIIGDLVDEDDATDVVAEANLYATSHDRFLLARAQVPDARKAPTMSKRRVAMTGAPQVVFAEVGATGDTITRATGSFITDGFAVGDVITVTGSVSNNVTGPIASLTATVITLGSTDLANETVAADTAGFSIVASPGITFAEVGATGDTITRSSGSWILDGFKVGDVVTIDGTASNDTTTDAITGVTATVLTLDTTDLTAEVIGSHSIDITAPAQTLVECVQANDLEFGDVDAQRRIDLSLGRARYLSPILGHRMRRPSSWAIAIREFQQDLHLASWRKAAGPLAGWDLEDEDGFTVEHDERITGGALAARFSCLRSWANGPAGTFVAKALTRAGDDALLALTHNMDVTNLACTVIQAETENVIGEVLQLNGANATEASLSIIEQRINAALGRALLEPVRPTGTTRASAVKWTATRDDDLTVPDATLTGEAVLNLNGTISKVSTAVKVRR